MKTRRKPTPGHDALLFSISGAGPFICPVSQTRLDTPRPLFTQSWGTGGKSKCSGTRQIQTGLHWQYVCGYFRSIYITLTGVRGHNWPIDLGVLYVLASPVVPWLRVSFITPSHPSKLPPVCEIDVMKCARSK